MTLTLDRASLLASPHQREELLRLVRDDVDFLRGAYPSFDFWLQTKVLPGISAGERTVVVERRGGRAVGLLIVKHTVDESKLCTLRVRPEFEFRGMGVRLFTRAFDILNTTRPLLSVSEMALPKFSRIFDHFGFACAGAYQGLYLPQVQEFSYNGLLIEDENSHRPLPCALDVVSRPRPLLRLTETACALPTV
ncbi:GNAT family N-acetyltransferase [Pseudorhodoferax sp. Leaf267]|uniref:GNAT family N-acetyltransferase n=1 Tax=Pseudorhodoferax sp. Leaf267 TaxID=1736316 RepID=UPI0012E14277|nr:GNAT family N-acetyltransferase [Pseudorhodoferax sp. Leaf267]